MRGTQRIAIVAFVLAALGAPLRAQGPEGVTVHGHWTIDVKDSNGTLIRRHDFENALEAPGALNLAAFLGRVNSPGLWVIALVTGSGSCWSGSNLCGLSENRWWDTRGGDLTLSTPNGQRLVLTGSFTSPNTVTFTGALSGVRLCPAVSPGCPVASSDLLGNFTLANFAPISVEAGQIVQVTVAFTFS